MAEHREKRIDTKTAVRINDAARRLSRFSLNGPREKKFDDRYVRHSIALDPDTPFAGKFPLPDRKH